MFIVYYQRQETALYETNTMPKRQCTFIVTAERVPDTFPWQDQTIDPASKLNGFIVRKKIQKESCIVFASKKQFDLIFLLIIYHSTLLQRFETFNKQEFFILLFLEQIFQLRLLEVS